MVSSAALLIFGLVIVWFGAEGFIRGGRRIAAGAGISPLIVGLTFGAVATSLPEISVSWAASFSGAGAMALGNAAGSNIANTGLALGLGVLIYPMAAEKEILRNDFWFLLIASLLFYIFTRNMFVGRLEALGLVVVFFIYILHIIKRHVVARRWNTDRQKASLKMPALFFVAGSAGLIAGGRIAVGGALGLAEIWNISQTVVGLSIVALGTSLPEIAVLVTGGIRKSPGISLGTIVGSNVLNILLVAGGAVLIRPVVISEKSFLFQAPAVVLFALLLLPLMAGERIINRSRGVFLLLCYVAYMGVLFLH